MKGRWNLQGVRFDKGFNDPDELRGKQVFGSLEDMAQTCKPLSGRLENEALQPEAVRKLLQVNRGNFAQIGRTA